jgi:nitrogen regulatory protein P-II 2
MKMITAFIRPEQLPDIKQALLDADVRHFTATTVMGTAPKTEQQMYRGVGRDVTLFRRVRLEVATQDDQMETAIRAIGKGAKVSGGYGKVFVTDLLDVVKFYTDERGEEAL